MIGSGRSEIIALIVLCGAATMALGCSSRKSDGQESASAAPELLLCGTYPLIDDDGTVTQLPEFYVSRAMNHKLRSFPDFAQAVGMNAVTNCDEARAFRRGQAEYSAVHPGFDANEPRDEPMPLALPRPAAPEAKIEVGKTLNGGTFANLPVVKIDYHPPAGTPRLIDGGLVGTDSGISCTGFFIAKNWIATAAHCMTDPAITRCLRAMPPRLPIIDDSDRLGSFNKSGDPRVNCVPDWNGWNAWDITFTDSAGNIGPSADQTQAYTITGIQAQQYIDPLWTGSDMMNPDDEPEHDFALLYVEDDRRLPPRIDLQGGSTDGALRLSIINPRTTDALNLYGFGVANNRVGITQLTRISTGGAAIQSINQNTFKVRVNSSSEGTTCRGDSGGPITRVANVPTEFGGVGGDPRQIVVGVVSRSTKPMLPNRRCANLPGDVHIYVNVSGEVDFVEQAMRSRYASGFTCSRLPSVGNGLVDDFAQCWGSPCGVDDDCADSEYCRRSGKFLNQQCPTCGCPTCSLDPTTCDCVVGQCITGPRRQGTDGGMP